MQVNEQVLLRSTLTPGNVDDDDDGGGGDDDDDDAQSATPEGVGNIEGTEASAAGG